MTGKWLQGVEGQWFLQ